MNNDGGKIWFGLGLDNDQLRADAQRSKQIFLEIGNQAEKEGAKIDASIKKAATAWLGFLSMREASRFALSIAKVRGEFQQLEVAFNTMLGSKAKADALMAQIVETAAKTPFDLQGVANGAKQYIGVWRCLRACE